MKFGIGIIPHDNLDNLIASAKLAEDAGFEFLWIGDYPNCNLYEILEAIAKETESIKIGPGVTNPYIRKPQTSAFEIMNINSSSFNRAVFGIGPGNKDQAEELGKSWEKPIATLKESLASISNSFQQEKNQNIPIYIGAQSPKLSEIAGELADGALINASHPSDYEYLIKHIESGISNAEKDIRDFDIAAYTATSIGCDLESAKNAAKIVTAFIIAGASPALLERHEIPQKISREIYFSISTGNVGGAVGLIDDNLLDIFSVTGTQDEIIEKIKSLEKSGVTQYVAGPPLGQDTNTSIKLMGDVISSF